MTSLASASRPMHLSAALGGSAASWLRRSLSLLVMLLGICLAGFPSSAGAAEPPAAPSPAVPYYIAEGGETRGPMSLELVIADIAEGGVLPWTLVWKPGLSAWIRAGDLAELATALAEATPRPPPPPAQPPPPPADLPEEAVYFVAAGDAPRGPLSEAEVIAAIAAGEVDGATLVWHPGAPDWVRADTVPAFAGRFTVEPPDVPAVERMRQLMIGSWEFVPPEGESAGARTRLTFDGDMTFDGEVSVAVPGGEPLVREISGEWSVEDAAADRFTLLMVPAGGAPGRVGLRVVDRDTLANETDGGSARRLPQ